MRVCVLFSPLVRRTLSDALGMGNGLIRLRYSLSLCCIAVVGRHRCRTLGIIIKSTWQAVLSCAAAAAVSSKTAKTELDYSRFPTHRWLHWSLVLFALGWLSLPTCSSQFGGGTEQTDLLLQGTFNWLESTELDDTDGFTANVFPSGHISPDWPTSSYTFRLPFKVIRISSGDFLCKNHFLLLLRLPLLYRAVNSFIFVVFQRNPQKTHLFVRSEFGFGELICN